MDLNQYTQKAQALLAAQNLAQEHNHGQIEAAAAKISPLAARSR